MYGIVFVKFKLKAPYKWKLQSKTQSQQGLFPTTNADMDFLL